MTECLTMDAQSDTHKRTHSDDIVVLTSIKSLVIGGIACGVMALPLLYFGVAGLIGLVGGDSGGIGWWVLYLFLSALGGIFLLCMILVWRLNPAPALIVNHEGITDAGDIGLIPWAQITDITVFTHEGSEYLGIVVADLKALYAGQSAVDRWTRQALMPNTHAIDSMVLSVPVAELAQAIKNHPQGHRAGLSRPAPRG